MDTANSLDADRVVRAPFPTNPEDFDADTRISFDKTADTYILEDEGGEEWEWLATASKWTAVMDEALMEQQRQAYKMAGVDENEPADVRVKRKADDEDGEPANGTKKQKAEKKERRNTAVYITSLPDDVTEDELRKVFSRCGVIAESPDTNDARIKLYYDEEGKFKGDALIVYFRPESVTLAISMLDETDFRFGEPAVTGPMRVNAAEASYKAQKDQPLASEQAKKKGTTAHRDRSKVIKKTQEMNNRLADWDDDDAALAGLPDVSSRWDKVVVLKHMFTLAELAADAGASLDVKADVRDECGKFGHVTNVVLYDQEEAGVVTVRFSSAVVARACVSAFNGRWFDRQRIEAFVSDGREKFKKSARKEDDEEEEKARLEKFSRDIEEEDVEAEEEKEERVLVVEEAKESEPLPFELGV